MTEIERVRRFEKMNESSLYKSIKDHDEFNILYILSRIEYMQARNILCVDRKIYITIKYEYLSFLKTQTTFVTFLLVRFFIHYLQRISWSRKC